MSGQDGTLDGQVDMTTFVTSFMRLSGETMSTDLNVLSIKVAELHKTLAEFVYELRNSMRNQPQTQHREIVHGKTVHEKTVRKELHKMSL